jgi:acyl-CoA hydrolase
VVSCPRADADIVVTEHGVARLRDKSMDERAGALIAIAEPAFRDGLAAAWEALRRSGLTKGSSWSRRRR